jgi:tRNA dimethylallyltransferase
MDIGTAKPTPTDRGGVPHHGIDWAEVSEHFSVADYAQRAKEVVGEVTGRGKPLLVLGGSGFYLRSFFNAPTDGIGSDPRLPKRFAVSTKRRVWPGWWNG